ncbi:pyridoxamine 5'-phosphate oxidase family protein [Geodermatophilus sp. TF02-6]|uniref:pyridoxamine 5'-phosphate oxidase family protein n=1 Tax=Geodermatophilus sp. TF02-6 TaxID=2250575 RepID=UPI0013141AC3|nr:pyridoxamine 5'-phosphate oxidase family protein [Geodermatophilus sp. TF02-6]
MPTTDDDREVEVLAAADCERLLDTVRIGRLGYTLDAMPAIQPVSFRLHRSRVVIPVRAGSRLLPGRRGAVVAFEVDCFDEDTRTGWTVTVVGLSRSVTDPGEIAVLDTLPWPPPTTRPGRYLSVGLGLVRGWRTVPRQPAGSVARLAGRSG